jgi:hypothetical protein
MSRPAQMGRTLFFTLVAVAAGMALQCTSDPEFQADAGKAVDGLLADLGVKMGDGIGPKADAAPGGLKRTVLQGKTDASGNLKVCGGYDGKNPPTLMLWLSSSQDMSSTNGEKADNYRISNGCIEFDGSLYEKNKFYRLVVIQ